MKQKRQNNFRLLFLILIGLLIYSCEYDDDFSELKESAIEEGNSFSLGEKIILGKKLKNPYSVENMKIAFSSLKKSKKYNNKSARNTDIIASHYYVKFKPKTTDELKMLEADTTLVLYDYPLDYEILQMGEYYHDPEVPDTQPTYQYASIKTGYQIKTNVEYEILTDLFIPDEEDIPDDFTSLLVDESLKLTNNLEPNENTDGLLSRRSKWRPAGRIMVWDDQIKERTRVFSHWEYYNCNDGNGGNNGDEIEPIIQPLRPIDDIDIGNDEQCKRAIYTYITSPYSGSYIPVHGAKVRARRWFTTHTGITNAQGYYSCNGRFRRPANYKIKWKRHDFSIWWSWLSAAKYNGPKKRGDWNLNIKGGTQEYYATIFRGAHLYYYDYMFGLTRPPNNRWWRNRLVIWAKKENGRSSYHSVRGFFTGGDIRLKAYGRETDKVFGVTIHELAHAAHREVDGSSYGKLVWKGYTNPWLDPNQDVDNPTTMEAKNARRTIETWASTVEHFIVKNRYKNYYSLIGYNYNHNLQRRSISSNNFYTSCGLDMIDDFNQRNFYGSNYPIDRVKGYNIKELELSLVGVTTWNSWKNTIKSKYNNSTEQYLDELFANWTN